MATQRSEPEYERTLLDTHGVFGLGAVATAATLPGFAVSVDTVLDAR